MGGTSVGVGYDPPESSERLRICPRVLECDPSITGIEESDAIFGCTNGVAEWVLAETTSARFDADDMNTTVYVFGNAGRLASDGASIVNDGLGLVIAHDVTDGPLP